MEVKHIDGYDCIDDNLRIVLNNYGIDIRRIFNKLWYFKFNKNSNKNIGEGLMLTNDNKYKELKENFNINYEIYENKNRDRNIMLKDFGKSNMVEIEKIDEIIKNKCTKENIIILELNTFEYEYDKGFKKYIGTHSCIMTEKNYELANVIDVWYGLYNKKIEYKNLLNAITRIIVLDISNIKEKNFKPQELYLLDQKSINEMKDFLDSIEKINLKEEYLGLDIEMAFKAPIDKGLRKIIMNRQRYAYYLYYLSEKTKNRQVKELGEYIFTLAMEWAKLRNILIQTYFLNKTLNIKQIKNIIQKTIEKEIEIKKEFGEIKW